MSNLDKSLSVIQRYHPDWEELAYIWSLAEESQFLWDPRYPVFAGRRSRKTERAIFGTLGARVLWRLSSRSKGESVNREARNGGVTINLPLPPDALIIRPYLSRGPIVASEKEGKVLKLFGGKEGAFASLENEIEALKIAQDQDLAEHIPTLLGYGTTSSGVQWMLSTLAPNVRPFNSRLETFCYPLWHFWLRRRILPFMARFYERAGLEYVNAELIMDKAEELLNSGRPLGFIERIIDTIRETERYANPGVMVRSKVHGDISPPHIHRDGSNWKIVDWGASVQNYVFYDTFRAYWSSPGSGKPECDAFWRWVGGHLEVDGLPRVVASKLDVYTGFYSRNYSNGMTAGQLRVQMMYAVLDEVLGIETDRPGSIDDSVFESCDYTHLPEAVRNAYLKIHRLIGSKGV